MMLPDVSVLLRAHNEDSPDHELLRDWWAQALSGEEMVALPWATILGFVRISTGRAAFTHPLTAERALSLVEEWLAQPNVRIVQPTHRHASLLSELLRAVGTAGNLTTDAHLAALAIEHGCTLYSLDADFARFPGLRWRNPATPRR